MDAATQILICAAGWAVLILIFRRRLLVLRPIWLIGLGYCWNIVRFAFAWWFFLARERLKDRRRHKVQEFLATADRVRLSHPMLENID